ncbi:helix-turn-helix domain-containing protein [Paenibacillus sp. GCM10027626]|uniref:helix-turn-helix domain-containing protein n=1 Tax=Paenibacillus sp. GCM10027626 TaxID=3273411 RepID=UPI00363FAEB3
MREALYIRSFIGAHDSKWEDAQYYEHSSLEITLIMEGSGYFRWADKQASVEMGQIVLIPSFLAHSFHACAPIRFGVLLIDGLSGQAAQWFHQLLPGPQQPGIITLSPLDQEQYELLFRQWLRTASTPLKDPEASRHAWLQVLLLFIYEHSHASRQALSVSHIADYIRQHLQTGLQISELAKLAGLSEEGLRKRFVKVFGMTPKHYQKMCRLAEAKWLLAASDRDMQAIAEAIGFSQLHSFSSWFKEAEGVAPTEWRRQQRLYHQ